ncbi:hypothetical protein DRO54_07330 [Candidatus Bathyarchaeota archaeon]|nr:MAG: hypothetical protein DRO54_07330 [Candidatus Bathyarchaeota archaeon]
MSSKQGDIITYVVENIGKALRGEKLSGEEIVVTLFTSLFLAAAAAPLIVSTGFAVYDELKKRKIIK